MNERERERLISEASELLLQDHGPMHDDITDDLYRYLPDYRTEKGKICWTLLRRRGECGFASFYLKFNWLLHDCPDSEDSEWATSDEISVTIYKKLIEIDRKLGTSETEQLYDYLSRSTRLDLIKVCLKVLTLGLICNHAFIFTSSLLI